MILQALHDLYDRFLEDPDYAVAPNGYSLQKISFVVVLNEDGTLHQIQDHRIQDGKQKRSQIHQVLGEAKPTGSGVNPCFLWDNTSYLLGYKPDDEKPERTLKCFETSAEKHLAVLHEIESSDYEAVCHFFKEWRPEEALSRCPILSELATGFGLFQIRGKQGFIHQNEEVVDWWKKQVDETDKEVVNAMCLLSGEDGEISDLHQPKIKGVKDAQGAGALIVSFNAPAYESYSKDSGFNAPVSSSASEKYCKSLNALLSSRKHRLQIGEATTVFWTGEPTRTEAALSTWFHADGDDVSAQDEELVGEMKGILNAAKAGQVPSSVFGDDPATSFYILGLTGQAGGRIGIRFWYSCSIKELLEKLGRHHEDISLEPQWGEGSKNPDPEFPAVWQLLRQTGRESKDIPPTLGGALMRAILAGGPYPQLLAASVINRVRADRTVSYLKAAILKGWLARLEPHNQGLTMSLNIENMDPAYRLGRLFAALEKTQQDALGNVNAGLRERFYSSASANPGMVFPRMMRTYQHHLAKLNPGQKVNREILIQEIMAPLEEFPTFLNLRAQASFTLGYYHQRQHFYTKKEELITE